MRDDHRFLLTSITKGFTAVQVMQLVAEGAVRLDEPVGSYVEEFARHGKEAVTTRHLLNHTSGLDLVSNTAEGPPSSMSATDHLQWALDAGLNFSPGNTFEYCSPGFWVLAEMVTRLRGMDYAQHLLVAIAEPLGMTDTRYEPAAVTPERYAGATAEFEGHLPEQVRRLQYPAGGLVSSASDLLAFGRHLLPGGVEGGPVLLSGSALRALARTEAAGWYKGREVVWGLGWELAGPGDFQSERTLFHYGGSGTGIWIDPELGVVLVLLTTSWHLSWKVYGEIANAVYGAFA